MRNATMLFSFTLVLSATAVLVWNSTAAQTVPRSQLGTAFEIRYGVVVEKVKIKVESRAPQGAVVGGIVGASTSGHHHRGKHAAEGALAGALLAAVLDGNRHARAFTVELNDGTITKVITEQRGIQVDDCVAVELGQTANIRRVSNVQCEHRGHEALSEPIVASHRQSEAAECHTAKEQALQATTNEATDIALKKVQVFCEG